MTILSRSLIASAGSGAASVSYWVARVTTSPNLENSYRAAVNEADETIIVRTSTQSSADQGYIELDYDGGYQSAKTTAMASVGSSGYQASIECVGGKTYIANQSTYYNARILERESASDTTYTSRGFSLYGILGFQNTVAHSHFLCADEETADDRLVFVGGGYSSEDYGYTVYQPRFVALTWNTSTLNIDSYQGIQGSPNLEGYGSRWAQVAKGNNQKFAVTWTDTASTMHGFATYYNGATPSFIGALYPSSANMKNLGIGIDANDKMSAVTGVSNQCWVFRGNTAGVYTPNVYYIFDPSSIGGYPMSAAFDSEGNAYILTREMYLIKFNTLNQIEWTLYLDNTQTTYQSAEGLSEVKVETIGDTEFLLLSLQYPPESTTRPGYIVKAPLDLNNYLGTYGNLQISLASFNPTVYSSSAGATGFYDRQTPTIGKFSESITASSSGATSSATVID